MVRYVRTFTRFLVENRPAQWYEAPETDRPAARPRQESRGEPTTTTPRRAWPFVYPERRRVVEHNELVATVTRDLLLSLIAKHPEILNLTGGDKTVEDLGDKFTRLSAKVSAALTAVQ